MSVEPLFNKVNDKLIERSDLILVDGEPKRIVANLEGALLDYYYHLVTGHDEDSFRKEFARIGHAAHPHYNDVKDEDMREAITKKFGAYAPLA